MTAFKNHKEALETHEFMMGVCRGRLAVSLDILTDALTKVGMHAVYCRNSRTPDKPKLDIETIMREIDESKELIISVMEELKRQRDEQRAKENAQLENT